MTHPAEKDADRDARIVAHCENPVHVETGNHDTRGSCLVPDPSVLTRPIPPGESDGGCVPCRVCGGSQNRGWHRHDTNVLPPAQPDCSCGHPEDDHVFTAGGFCNECGCQGYVIPPGTSEPGERP